MPPEGAAPAIDVHTHVVPQEFPRYLGTAVDVPWPSMAPAHACHRHVMVSGKVYRTVSHQCWDCTVRQQDMQRLGIGRQVLSPMPELLSYWFPAQDGAAIAVRGITAGVKGSYINIDALYVKGSPGVAIHLDSAGGPLPSRGTPVAASGLADLQKEAGRVVINVNGVADVLDCS